MLPARRHWLPALFALAACTTPPPPPPDAAPTDALAPPDAIADVPADDAPPRGSLAPVREPEPLPVAQWMVATVSNPAAGDPVRTALEAGTFTLPPEGLRDGVEWSALTPADDGGLGYAAPGYLYAAAALEVPAGRHAFARADTVLTLITNNAAYQPGDVYASGRMRVPIATRAAGANLLVVRALGGRGDPRVQLYTTPDELVFNLEDVTAPDLVAGDASEQYLGVPVLNVTDAPALDVVARVEASELFEASEVAYPALAAGAVSQLAFRLTPRGPFPAAGRRVTVGLRLESPSLQWSYRREVTLETVAAGATYKRTFRSAIDGSAQYYGVVPPRDFDPARTYGLVLALHGASVEGIGHARAYSARDQAYIVAPTNRRPYGFDWEEWGRLDGLEVLDHAAAAFRTAPDRVYLTGHSMGGHGTWQLGVLFPGRFAVAGPSAGWISFETYARARRPTGAIGRARASSNTLDYASNLVRRGVYAIHGSADTNVPVTEARTMVAALRGLGATVDYHEQPGAGHWWDGEAAPGADCVDWPPLFDLMNARRLDPLELEFRFVTPGPYVSPRHSYVTVLSEADAYQDVVLESARVMGTTDTVALTTTNVRTLRLDGAGLRARGVTRVAIDGRAAVDVPEGPLVVGPETGKTPERHGPINQVFQRPFCFVYADDGPAAYRHYAAFLLSTWALVGNGHGCALPLSRVTDAVRAERNLVYLGVAPAQLPWLAAAGDAVPFRWDAAGVALGETAYPRAALAFVYPEGARLAAVYTAAPGAEYLLFRLSPFSSQAGLPDYFVWDAMGGRASGFFTPEWRYTPGR